jgi:hypothetical protein
MSTPQEIQGGMPQGSALTPTLYSTPSSHLLMIHLYIQHTAKGFLFSESYTISLNGVVV